MNSIPPISCDVPSLISWWWVYFCLDFSL